MSERRYSHGDAAQTPNGETIFGIGADGNVYALPLTSGGSAVAISGSFTSATPTSNTATAPSQTTVGTGAATALSANANRKGLSIQNQGTTVLYVLLGGGTPTSSNYTVALPACGSINDGSSPPWSGVPGVVWTGAVQWISSAAGGLGEAIELT